MRVCFAWMCARVYAVCMRAYVEAYVHAGRRRMGMISVLVGRWAASQAASWVVQAKAFGYAGRRTGVFA